MALRDLEIRALVGRYRIYKKADERGLYLEVHPNGSKLWRFKYRLAGKDKRIAIGRYPDVGLADARRARDDASRQIQVALDSGHINYSQNSTVASSAIVEKKVFGHLS